MAATLIERFTTSFDHSRYEDEYRSRLLKLIRRKRKGDDVQPAPQEEREAPSDLLAALRESVEAAKGTSRAKNGRKAAKPKRRTSSAAKSRHR
jgi:DNA end-binding protein Ku